MNVPTCNELCEQDPIKQESDPSWRHGTYETWVFRRDEDNTYWRASFRLSGDGETNELREGLAVISQVYPHTVQTTVYKDQPEDPAAGAGRK